MQYNIIQKNITIQYNMKKYCHISKYNIIQIHTMDQDGIYLYSVWRRPAQDKQMRPRGMDIASQRHRFELHQGQREVMLSVSSHHTLQKSSRGVTGHPNSLGPQWRLLQWHQWHRCSCHQVIL